MGISYFLPRLVGASRSAELLLTGRVFDAAEAHDIGLVIDAVDEADLPQRAVTPRAASPKSSPLAVWMTTEAIWQTLDAPSLSLALDIENRMQIMCTTSGETTMAFHAFVEGRRPEWSPL
jgi:enoyl-CoA hydratase